MPRKQEESAAKRKPSPASEVEAKPTKAAAKTAGAKTKSAAAKKTSPTKTAAKKTAAKAPAKKTSAKPEKSAGAAKSPSAAPKKSAKPKAAKKTEPELETPAAPVTGPIEDPIGDTTDGEAQRLLVHENESEAEEEIPAVEAQGESDSDEEEAEAESEPRPEPHLERLQKVLSQAGIASRRHAEEMIVAGRVMVNGQVVTQLGAKADPARDHIRVDGKMIQGAERHRTFVLNKPKGFVTTVTDPEGRATVMQFFQKMKERLYPVGRLDYQSEGLLLMTNDGDLANALTRAASGVEKTYLVKVSGQPTEEELEQLRRGVSIDREQAGSGRVMTAPASVAQVRTGDNPWYEVILTEGRNRELRKMFQAIGHFVEKIRRVGYGPLVLDVEPGQFRELSDEEVTALRLTAEGKLKPRRPKSLAMLPKEAGRAAGSRPGTRPGPARPGARFDKRSAPSERPFRRRDERSQPAGERGGFGNRPTGAKREGGFKSREGFKPREGQAFGRPAFTPGDRPRADRPERRTEGSRGDRPRFNKPGFDRPASDRPRFNKPGFAKPGFEKARFEKSDPGRSGFDRPRPPRADARPGSRPPFQRRDEGPANRGPREGQRPSARPEQGRQFGGERPRFDKPRFDKPRFDKPRFEKPHFERPARPEQPGFSIEEVQPGSDFQPRERTANRGGMGRGGPGRPSGDRGASRPGGRGEKPNRFGAPRFDRERSQSGRGGERQTRPASDSSGAARSDSTRGSFRGGTFGGAAPRAGGGPGRTGGGNARRGPGGAPGGRPGGRPGGFQRSGFRGKPGGGPRRDRG